MAVTAAVFAQAAVPAVPEGVLDTVFEKVRQQSACHASTREEGLLLTGWWAMATPRVRVAYSLVLAVLMVAGLYMGGDLWKTKPVQADAFPGIDVLAAVQPGSIEQAYYLLTSNVSKGGAR